MNWLKKNVSVIVIILAGIFIVMTNFNHHKWLRDDGVIEWDVKGYYSYLPATFIYKDLKLDFLDGNNELFQKMWPVRTDEGDRVIVTSCGMSILYSPFFFIAHGLAHLTSYEADGYSMPYRFALAFSALFYFLLGMIFMRKILKRYFSEVITVITMIAVAIGTNLFYYTTYEAPLTHGHSFGLIALFVWLSIRWHRSPKAGNTIGLGFLFGLISLIRPTNILVLLFFVLWDVKSFKELKERILFFIRRYNLVLLMLLFFLIAWLPQFAYWKYITGHWIFYSYGAKDAGFFFNNPQIFNILISYKKGWFVYTPVMAIAFVGIFFMIKRLPAAFWAVLVYMLAMIYVLSSWWCWWFGGGFGLRAFVETYAIMAIPLASLLDVAFRKKIIGISLTVIIAVLTAYNLFQIRQYRHGAIHFWWMNKEAYWANFLKLHPTEKYFEVRTKPNYEKARDGIYEEIPFVSEKEKNQKAFYEEFEKYIRNNKQLMDSLKNISKNDDELSRHIDTNMDVHAFNYIYEHKQPGLNKIIDRLSKNSELMKKIRKKADEKNITAIKHPG